MERITTFLKETLIRKGFTAEAAEQLVRSSFLKVGDGKSYCYNNIHF
jgi:hypothetical protein